MIINLEKIKFRLERVFTMKKLAYRKRRLFASVVLLYIMITLTMSFTAFANPMSLDDLVGNPSATQTQPATEQAEVNTGNSTVNNNATPPATGNTQTTQQATQPVNSSDVYGSLADAGRVNLNNEKAKAATSGLANIVGVIVSFLCYAIVIGLTLRVVLDLMYVCIPPVRRFLCTMPAQNPQGGTPGMSGTGMGIGGIGGIGGMGIGGMNRGIGSMGVGSMGMGGMGIGGTGQNPMAAQQATGGVGFGGIQWISKAAQNAVTSEGTPDPTTGKPLNPLKLYAKDMVVVLVMVPILIVLATNGSLIDLGFRIAELITSILYKIGQ